MFKDLRLSCVRLVLMKWKVRTLVDCVLVMPPVALLRNMSSLGSRLKWSAVSLQTLVPGPRTPLMLEMTAFRSSLVSRGNPLNVKRNALRD